jgi:hypothetical protein
MWSQPKKVYPPSFSFCLPQIEIPGIGQALVLTNRVFLCERVRRMEGGLVCVQQERFRLQKPGRPELVYRPGMAITETYAPAHMQHV